MALDSLRDLYVEKLKDLYSAESQIIRALPRMIKNTSTPELQQALQQHLKVTEGHARRIEQIARGMGESPRGKKCAGMEGLLEEGKELLQEQADSDVLDAGIIAAAQSVEHYEIAGYGTARTWAQLMGEGRAANLLEQTLNEEKEADQLLSQLAESFINAKAEEGDEEDMAMAGNSSRRR
ncbi:MAG TPA: ferritin-like domain-containing protein [Anaerolineae bacterium]|nr:ferritin-like domain-containing protein [Anaerolineae bacterium]